MNKAELARRYLVFTTALFVSALGVSIITKSYMGTSPISGIPFVMSLNTPLSMGTYIFILNMALIALQMLMLGKKGIFENKMDLIMQIPVSVLFGFFIDLTMGLLNDFTPTIYLLKLTSLILGTAVLAIGICLEVVADVTMVSGEYTVQIASKRFSKEFGTVKIAFDISLVVIATIASLLLSGKIEGIREGTIIAALITGPFVRLFSPMFSFLLRWEKGKNTITDTPTAILPTHKVITIAREYGCGGHVIGRRIADELGIPFYDKELIKMVAKESGLSEKYVSQNEQHLSSSLLYQMVMQDYEAPLEKRLSGEDALFVAQSRVIRRLSSEGSCVIVGRCANFILQDNADAINIFLHADMKAKISRSILQYGLSPENAQNEIERINKSRQTHFYHFTGWRWDDMHHYHFTFDTGKIDTDTICQVVQSYYKTALPCVISYMR
ncbi:MAG: cytidylate kinase family protein [Flavobacteriales bacterium]|nr:cytidylate kinase family protein [Flavobacteriales bacterium]